MNFYAKHDRKRIVFCKELGHIKSPSGEAEVSGAIGVVMLKRARVMHKKIQSQRDANSPWGEYKSSESVGGRCAVRGVGFRVLQRIVVT